MVMIIFCINDPDHLISKICRSLRFNLRPTVPARFTLNLQFPSDISFITNDDTIVTIIIVIVIIFFSSQLCDVFQLQRCTVLSGNG